MATVVRAPPGRAGRGWLLRRIEATRRGADLLDRKRKLLEHELNRLAERRRQAQGAWEVACGDAERWALRAVLLGGAAEVARAARPVAGTAVADVPSRNTMGVVHPGEPACSVPVLPPVVAAGSNSATSPAAAAAAVAVRAAVALAALDASYRLLEAELNATKRRVRAITHHRLPALQRALDELELRLDELERGERIVTRWAAGRAGPRR